MDATFAEHFAQDWIEAWNSHDLPRVLAHYADDFEMSSPLIRQITGDASGMLKGKAAVQAYWEAALQRVPDLRFELVTVLLGAQSITLYYKGVGGRLAAEAFHFSANGQVTQAFAHYAI